MQNWRSVFATDWQTLSFYRHFASPGLPPVTGVRWCLPQRSGADNAHHWRGPYPLQAARGDAQRRLQLPQQPAHRTRESSAVLGGPPNRHAASVLDGVGLWHVGNSIGRQPVLCRLSFWRRSQHVARATLIVVCTSHDGHSSQDLVNWFDSTSF